MIFKPTALAIALLATLPASAQQPDAKTILEGARMSATLAKLDDGENIQFQFSENGKDWRGFHMNIGDNAFKLSEIINGKMVNFPAAKLVSPIAGTDLTYEDLALRFFYWPNPKLDGQENVGGEACFKIRIDKPKGTAGRYEVVYVWVHTKFGAFMRIRGHDKSGGLVKEFQVEDVMKVATDMYTLRKMQVSTHDPATGRRISITDVTFDAPKKVTPRSLH
jgi:hypothetical protein